MKILKLINNERKNITLTSSKACSSGAYDKCTSGEDYADCTLFAYDVCTKKDYAACYEGADDYCGVDTTVCGGPGAEDNT